MFRNGFHPKIRYVLAFCLMYGWMSLTSYFVSLVTWTLFAASLYSPSASDLVELQEDDRMHAARQDTHRAARN